MAKLSRIARPQTRFMQSNEIGEVAAEENAYGFNHAVRGYDPEEVDDYINNLFGNYKNTQNVLNKQKEEFETEREMLQCEINDLHGKNSKICWRGARWRTMVCLRSIHVSEQVCTYVHRRINGAELASHHGSPLLGNIPVRVKRS